MVKINPDWALDIIQPKKETIVYKLYQDVEFIGNIEVINDGDYSYFFLITDFTPSFLKYLPDLNIKVDGENQIIEFPNEILNEQFGIIDFETQLRQSLVKYNFESIDDIMSNSITTNGFENLEISYPTTDGDKYVSLLRITSKVPRYIYKYLFNSPYIVLKKDDLINIEDVILSTISLPNLYDIDISKLKQSPKELILNYEYNIYILKQTIY